MVGIIPHNIGIMGEKGQRNDRSCPIRKRVGMNWSKEDEMTVHERW